MHLAGEDTPLSTRVTSMLSLIDCFVFMPRIRGPIKIKNRIRITIIKMSASK